MNHIFLQTKSRLFSYTLKLMGVCGVLILFEACYGTPKSAYAPNKEGKNPQTSVNSSTQQDSAKTTATK